MSYRSDTITLTLTHDEVTTLTIALWQAQYYQKGETPSKPISEYRLNVTNDLTHKVEELDRMISRGYVARRECMEAIAAAANDSELQWV